MSNAAVVMSPTEIVKSSVHPALISVAEKRAADVQLRVADAITKFAGSMTFVYVHIVLFAVWMAKADHDFVANEQELKVNTELTKAIHDMTTALHNQICGDQQPPTAG